MAKQALSENLIERMIERRIDRIEELRSRNSISDSEYEREIYIIEKWSEHLYRELEEMKAHKYKKEKNNA